MPGRPGRADREAPGKSRTAPAPHGRPPGGTRARRHGWRGGLVALLTACALIPVTAPTATAASVATWDKVAACESGGDWAINTGNGYYGGLQIHKATWDDFGGTQYSGYPHQATKEQQIRVAEKILATQGPGAWPVCGARARLGDDHADPYPAEPPAPQSKMAQLTPVGDLTGDGRTELLAVEKRTGDLYRYSAPGFGGSTRVKLGYGWNGMSRLLSPGDLTGDGVADLLAVHARTGDLYRYSGPRYGGSTRVKVGTNWDSMTKVTPVGDQTGDGVPDLIAVEASSGDLYRYSGPGFGGGGRVRIGHGWNVYDTLVGVGDLTGDGTTDLLAVHARTGELFRYSGPGYGGSTKVRVGTNWDSMTNLTGIGDLTGDGVPDLLAVDPVTDRLYRYSGPGFGGGGRVQIGTNW